MQRRKNRVKHQKKADYGLLKAFACIVYQVEAFTVNLLWLQLKLV